MQRSVWNDIVSWRTRRLDNSTKYQHPSFQRRRNEICRRIVKCMLSNCSEMFVRKYTCSRVFPRAKPLGASTAGTITGPISEVLIVKILDEFGVEGAIPSMCKPGDVTYVVISSETERYLNEIILTKQKPDPVENCSKIFQNPKKACLTYNER